jgi:phage gpG-like protein
MSVHMKVDVRGNKELSATLRRIEQATGRLRPLHKLFGIATQKWIDDNFRREGSPAWKSLRPNTVASRRQGSSRILQDSGALKTSFSYDADEYGVAIGSPLQIAEYHEDGTRPYVIRPKNRKFLRFNTTGGPVFSRGVNHPGLPKRKMLPTEAQLFNEVKLTDIAERYLQKVIERG